MESLHSHRSTNNVRNVCIFICDDLRYDYLPESIKELGVSAKMVAPSTSTLESVPSYLSGKYPSEHGYNESDDPKLGDVPALIKKNQHVGLNSKTSWYGRPPEERPLVAMNHAEEMSEVDDLDEPFVYVEHDYGVHSPYGVSYDEESDHSYWSRHDTDTLIEHYREASYRSAGRFFETLEQLEEREILDETLVIFVSDHGELLAEQAYGGIFAHKEPVCPELVYVPIVFIGAGLPAQKEMNSVVSGIDIAPTALSAQGHDIPDTMHGVDLWKHPLTSERVAFSETRSHIHSLDSVWGLGSPDQYAAVSAWDRNGGYVFHLNPRIIRFISSQYGNFYADPEAPANRNNFSPKNYLPLIKSYCKNIIKYGTPGFEIKANKQVKSLDDLQQYNPV